MKKLVGIVSAHPVGSNKLTATLGELLGLQHINMLQPVINMLAALIGEHPATISTDYSVNMPVGDTGATLGELVTLYASNHHVLNENFFINKLRLHHQSSQQTYLKHVFNGHIISNITTEAEAKWVRDEGGVIVHEYDYRSGHQFHALDEKDGDLHIIISDAAPLTDQLTEMLAEQINYHHSAQKQVA